MKAIERILLIDDNEADNYFHEYVLRKAGFTGDLKIFNSAVDALEYVRSLPDGPVCIILLDINMPGMDGWEFAHQATSILEQRSTVTLVMLTSSSSHEDQQRARSMSVIQGYLTKPLTRESAGELLQGRWQST
jgi:CheY-like chemotaxis protein